MSMCVYCSMIDGNGDNSNNFLMNREANFGILGWIHVDGLIMYSKKNNGVVPIIDWGLGEDEDFAKTEINFCPICGRNLNEFVQEHIKEGGVF